jgi:hypothetical protein
MTTKRSARRERQERRRQERIRQELERQRQLYQATTRKPLPDAITRALKR